MNHGIIWKVDDCGYGYDDYPAASRLALHIMFYRRQL